MSVSKDLHTIVIDCEGTDSKERGENRHHFEHCSSLFALALADVLIMNMWTQDVGRYTASNYGVLKMVFQMNLKLFQQECAKKILIVLRDYDEKRYKKEVFEKQILKDIDTLWADIKKPEQHANSTPNDFFEFEFVALPHKIYREEEFDQEVLKLRERFLPSHQNFLFNHSPHSKNVPIDGYLHYCSQIWDTVIHEKDLNIPGEKEMLAIYRCGEIRQEALTSVQNKVNELNEAAKSKQLLNFNERVKAIYNEALDIYDKSGRNYLDKIYLDMRNGLIFTLVNELYISFSSQISRIIPISTKMFTKDLEKELQNSKYNIYIYYTDNNFFEIVQKTKKQHLEQLKKRISDIRVFEEWNVSIAEYEENFDAVIDSIKKNQVEKLEKETLEKLRVQIKELLHEKLHVISDNFWLDFNKDFAQFSLMSLKPLKQSLLEYYRLEEHETEEVLNLLEEEIFSITLKGVEKKSKDLSSLAVEKFKEDFWYEEGLPRK